jgi:hypothetical protein
MHNTWIVFNTKSQNEHHQHINKPIAHNSQIGVQKSKSFRLVAGLVGHGGSCSITFCNYANNQQQSKILNYDMNP